MTPDAAAPPEAPEAPVGDVDPLSPYRVDFDALVEQSIGTTSVPVAFNWRRTNLHIAATGSYLAELNNFNGMRGGALFRVPSGNALVEFGATYAASWDSPSSKLVALTPYRQPGHPDRLELDLAVGLPLAEGVVTAFPKFFPAVEMVFNGYLGFRYVVYPTGFAHLTPGEVLGALVAPSLSEDEIDNLEGARLDGMQVDPGRYTLLLGLGDDLYFKNGLFLSPRLMMAVPLLAPITETQLYVWTDLSLAIGVAL